MVSANIPTGSKPYIVEDRPMISRSSGDRGTLHYFVSVGGRHNICASFVFPCDCRYFPSPTPLNYSAVYKTKHNNATIAIITSSHLMFDAIPITIVKITHTIEPGKEETGCMACFYSPPEYPILSKCPCFDYPEYVVNEIRASQ